MKKKIYTFLLALMCAIAGVDTMSAQAQWGTNLLQNTVPTSETQFTGWTRDGEIIGGLNWGVEGGWFKSSNMEGVLYQTVNLSDKGFTTESLAQGTLYAAVRYAIPFPGTYQSGICQAMVVSIDGAGKAIDTAYVVNRTGYTNTEVEPSPAVVLFNLPAGVAKLRYELHGRDQYGAAGRYGSCFTEMTMAIADNSATAYTASVSPAMGDSIVIDKMTGIKVGDTLTVRAKYAEHPVVNLFASTGRVIAGNKIICLGADMVVSAKLAYQYPITADVQHGTVNVSPATAKAGDTITLGYTVDDGYFFEKYVVSPEVKWIDDHRFIMPDAEVTVRWHLRQIHDVPFFEGFEENNAQDADIAGWWQESETGTKTWQANSTNTRHNRTPYNGKWNATLTESTRWMFAGIRLEAGKLYRFTIYARQDSKVSQASLRVCLGTSAAKEAMNTELLPVTKVNDGDYQLLTTDFSVPADGTYMLGIRGYISYPAKYLSIDNISIQERVLHSITCVSSVEGTSGVNPTAAYEGDTITVDKSVPEGYILSKLTTTPAVEWTDDHHFIMPDEDVTINVEVGKVHNVPFFEGFENGNGQGRPVADWLQYSTAGDSLWQANSTSDNAPFGGKWNATLYKNNMDWLFTYLNLEAGKQYRLSLYARQDVTATYGAYVEARIGTKAIPDSMKTEVIPSDNYLKGKDYQLRSGTFSVAESGVYALGIKGFAAYSINTLGIDDIRVTEIGSRSVRTTDTEAGIVTANKTDAQFGETVRLRHTMAEGEVFIRYTTDVAVVWVNDSCFVMPDADVTAGMEVLPMHTMPFYEGFEEGNTAGKPMVNRVIEGEGNDANQWKASTNIPYEGTWSAYLNGWNNDSWMFNAINLEAGKTYTVSLVARQDADNDTPEKQTIQVCIGSTAEASAMTTTLVPTTVIEQGGYYQTVVGAFTVPQTATYVLGICGHTGVHMPVEIDNIRVQEKDYTPYTVSVADSVYGSPAVEQSTATMGDTVAVSHTLSAAYIFMGYTTDIPVLWIDKCHFIMPNANVTVSLKAAKAETIPFFEGFEEGNTQGADVAGWLQFNENGTASWKANSTETQYNQTPYEGSWNAVLRHSNTDWLCRTFTFEKGKAYKVSLYARQDYQYKSYANISIYLGTEMSREAMTIKVLPATGVVNGDYQRLEAVFAVQTTAAYALGIRGYMSSSPYRLSIDNISIEEVPVVEVTPVVSATTLNLPGAGEAAIRKALAALTLTAVDAKDSVVYTFANKADLWTIDWVLQEAAYSLLSADLPAGYAFANEVETVRVALQNISTGVDNAAASALQVYPNPAADYICVAGAEDTIAIYDLTGHVVLSVPAAGDKTVIDITALPAGLYMVRAGSGTVPLLVR